MKRMPRPSRTLALLGAILAVFVGAVPVGAVETAALAQQWDPVPWVIGAACLVIASLAAADAKADRRRH
jgi:peptidoglycan/LPS O-acetylase OafA/YrhL